MSGPGPAGPGPPGGDDRRVPRPPADVEWVALDGEVVAYAPREGTIHRLNASAAAVWHACDGTRTVGRIVAELGAAVGPGDARAADRLASDVIRTVEDLGRAGLLETGGSPPDRTAR